MALSDDLRYLIEYDILRVMRILRTLVAELPRSFEARILLGDAHLRALEFDAAIEQYRAALSIEKGSRIATAKLALCAIYTGKDESALRGFEWLHSTGRDDQSVALAGLMFHRLNRPTDALARFEYLEQVAERKNPYRLLGLQARIRVLRALGRVDDADSAAGQLLADLGGPAPDQCSELHQRTSSYDFFEWSRIADKGELAPLLARHPDPTGDRRAPDSFVLPAERDRLAAFAATQPPGAVFVIKPRQGQGGQSIELTDDLDKALAAQDAVVQRYIDPPFLADGKKAHMRIYGLITSADPLRIYVYDDGIVRLAPQPYARGPGWLARTDMHVTNTALHRKHPLLVINQNPAIEDQGNVWTLKAYLRHVAAAGHDADTVFAAIGRLVGRFLLTLRDDGFFARQTAHAPARSFGHKLFGLDVLLDADARPWLIEIQRSPAWNGPPLVKRINGTLAETLVRMASTPLLAANMPPETVQDIRTNPTATTRREEFLEGTNRGGFVRLIHDNTGERDAARGGREIVL